MRLLFLGDVVGRPGREAVQRFLPALRARLKPDCVVINGENAAGGFGITEGIYQELLDAGADAITLGNHAFDQRETLVFIERAPRLVRPANLPPGTPGRGAALVELADGRRVLVINVLGRISMDAVDCPFRATEREIELCPLREMADAIVLDLHAEATAEKQALAWHFDGRVSLAVGTHTHVPTADHRLFPGGTAYQTDAGMCGDYLSVIGFDWREPTRRLVEKIPGSRWESASGDGAVSGVLVETDDRTGLARRVAPVRQGTHLAETLPDW
ncbi:MAG: TIGR00282 family metallophosphoesterase [Beijerinckiaceae bacterium]|jgi:metallophosphoesterase (TIGR00282 family)|nr:TIGR00282 family metallophosphoesterase [Beijerinckiaceae bacterium]